MGRPQSNIKTKLMRVPIDFDIETARLSKKYNYSVRTEFLQNETLPLMQRIDQLSDLMPKKRKRC